MKPFFCFLFQVTLLGEITKIKENVLLLSLSECSNFALYVIKVLSCKWLTKLEDYEVGDCVVNYKYDNRQNWIT